MNKILALLVFFMASIFVFNNVLADDHGGKKMDKQQHKEFKKNAKENEKAYKNIKKDNEDDDLDHHKNKKMDRVHDGDDHDEYKGDSVNKGLEKQYEKKANQMHKEQEKGSVQGKSSREEHSRKWWKFWEESS